MYFQTIIRNVLRFTYVSAILVVSINAIGKQGTSENYVERSEIENRAILKHLRTLITLLYP